MATPLRDATIRLRDGRSLAYCEWGHEGGPVVLAFHGSPGSRVWWPGAEVTAAAGARLVTVDRPGYGGSDPLPGRPIAGWAEDVVELADALGIDRFGVVGWSGGAPYAAAVAAELLPDRLTGVCLASSASIAYAVGPSQADDEDLHISELIDRFGPAEATVRYAAKIQAWAEGLRQDPGSMTNPDEFAAGDLWVLEQPEPRAGLFSSIGEGVRQGATGAATDWVNLLAPWGFSLAEIEVPVHMWHGGQDSWVQLADCERVVAAIPHAALTVWPDAGHFGPAKHWADVLAAALD
jgi:pimeloyl-ACP methyl ester carboxylesterase